MAVNHLRKQTRTNNTTPTFFHGMERNLLVMFSSSTCVLPPVPSLYFLGGLGGLKALAILDFLAVN